MNLLFELSALWASVGAGLVAGLCFAFASFILSAFDKLEPAQAIRAMQAINATILRTSAMVVWFGTAILGAVTATFAEERVIAIGSAVLYAFGAILITGRANVPLNESLDRVDPESPDAAAVWRSYRRRWGRWNVLRTVACAIAAVGFELSF